jgi:hypothetical protein
MDPMQFLCSIVDLLVTDWAFKKNSNKQKMKSNTGYNTSYTTAITQSILLVPIIALPVQPAPFTFAIRLRLLSRYIF